MAEGNRDCHDVSSRDPESGCGGVSAGARVSECAEHAGWDRTLVPDRGYEGSAILEVTLLSSAKQFFWNVFVRRYELINRIRARRAVEVKSAANSALPCQFCDLADQVSDPHCRRFLIRWAWPGILDRVIDSFQEAEVVLVRNDVRFVREIVRLVDEDLAATTRNLHPLLLSGEGFPPSLQISTSRRSRPTVIFSKMARASSPIFNT